VIRHLVPAAAVLAAATLAVPAAAQETQGSAAAKFSKEFAASDTNHNGALSLAEVQARTAHMRLTTKASSNPAMAKKLAGLWFSRADANRDGKVTEPEAQALLTATFARYDANKDGRIGTTERAAAKKSVEKGR
jgi:hypothetical protein